MIRLHKGKAGGDTQPDNNVVTHNDFLTKVDFEAISNKASGFFPKVRLMSKDICRPASNSKLEAVSSCFTDAPYPKCSNFPDNIHRYISARLTQAVNIG